MKRQNTVVPSMDTWRRLTHELRQRTSTATELNTLTECIDLQFMSAQRICNQVMPGKQQVMTIEQLLSRLNGQTELFLSTRQLEFVHSTFGNGPELLLSENDFLGIWCLFMEYATLATKDSRLEISMGTLGQKLELEIGTDCPSLENAQVLASAAFEFARHAMSIGRALYLKCPLGGAAIQIDISCTAGTTRRAA